MSTDGSHSKWIPIAKISDPIDRHGTPLEVEGEEIALFMIDGCRYAASNVCTHQFTLMTDGYVEGEYIVCPMHQGRFHIPTGAPQGAPVTKPLRVFALRVEGDDVLIEFSPSGKG
jgi:nitrite reductase/ring-hydroxylating ferredoxin subunit